MALSEEMQMVEGLPLESLDALGPVEGGPAEEPGLRAFWALRQIIHGLASDSRRLAASRNITSPQLLCLHTLVRHGPMTLTRLSHLVSLSPSTALGIIDRLQAKGLVERTRDLQDRRKIVLTPTAAAGDFLAENPLPLQERLIRAVHRLPALEQAAVADALERIVRSLVEEQ